MAKSYGHDVVETSTTTGVGTYDLGGIPAGSAYRTFRQEFATLNAKTVYEVRNASNTKWERNVFGTLTYGTPDTLSRNVVKSTNSDAAVSWVSGDLPLTIYIPADADVHEGGITGWLAAARNAIIRFGDWWKSDDPTAGINRRYLFDGTTDIPWMRVDPAAHVALIDSGVTGQVVTTETGAVATGTTLLPFDDTIPQNTEGDQYFTLSITPKNAASKLVIEAKAMASSASAGIDKLTMALFQDSTVNALAAAGKHTPAGSTLDLLELRHIMTAATISSTTFNVRIGTHSGSACTVNGVSGVRVYGGAAPSGVKIREVLP